MDVSRLGIVVESTGINEARKALDGGNGRGGLLGAAEKTEKVVVKLTDSLSKMLSANASGTTAAWNQSLATLGNTLNALNTNVAATTRALQGMAPAMQNAAAATNQAATANARKSSTGNVVTNTLKAMTTAAVAYNAVNLGMSVVKQADAWVMMQARLRNATGSMNNARAAQEQMFDLSQRLRVPLEESVKLYTRLAPAMQSAGKSSEYAKNMVEGIATALQLGGANGSETSSVMLQLSQSFSSGVLNGAEFNAVAENGSVLMKALRDSTGMSNAELKKLGSQGKLSMETVGKAIEKALPMWREQFDRLPLTFEGGMQRLKNAWTKAVGEMGEDTGFNKRLSEALRVIENMIPAIAQGLGNAFVGVLKWVDANKVVLGQIWDQVTGLIVDVLKLGASFASLTGAVVGVGEEISVWGLLIYTVRGMLAAAADIVKVVGAAFVHVGLDIGTFFVYPIYKALEGIQWLLDAFKKLIEFAVPGLRAIGKNDAADQLQKQADTIGEWATKAGDYAKSIDKFFTDARASVNGWTKDLEDGNGELDKFLRGDDLDKKIAAREKARMDEEAWAKNNPARKKNAVDPKIQDAVNREANKYYEALGHINAALREQQAIAEGLATKGLDYDKVGTQAKKLLELEEKLGALRKEKSKDSAADAARKADIGYTQQLIAAQKIVAAQEALNIADKARLTNEEGFIQKQTTTLDNLKQQTVEAEHKLKTYGMEKGALEELELVEARRALLAFELLHGKETLSTNEARMLSLLKEQVEWAERLKVARSGIGEKESGKEFDKLFDARKAEKFTATLTEGFGKAGKAMGQLANAADKYLARQAKIAQGRTILDKMDKSTAEYAKRNDKLMQEEAESRIASYADMAGAAKTFFEEGSKGYKAMEAAEKTFRLFQMAMQLKSFLQEIGFITTTTTAAVTGDAVKAASATASAGVQASASMVSGTAAAAAGVANQAGGDPYSAFVRMAAMAAIMAALGFAVGGGGKSVDVAKQRQAAQGTGTVFGDEKAKSESISKALDIVSKNSDIALRYSSGMLASLQNIEYSLTGATSGVIRTGSSVTGKGYENGSSMFGGAGGVLGATLLTGIVAPMAAIAAKLPLIGGLVTKLVTSLFGSTSTLKDSGLMGSSQSVAGILQSGFNVQAYQDVQTKKKLFGITYSDKTSTNTSPVDPAVTREFGNIVSGMVDSLANAAGALGLSGDLVRQKLSAVNIDIGKISLKDLSSEEIQKQLEAVFSAIGDKLSAVALPMLVSFQKAGEGLLETAVRVASGVETANYELEKLGITAVKFTDLVNKSGDVGAEIVRQSILMQEAGTGIKDIISTLTGTATDIVETYKSLDTVRDALQSLNLGNDVTRELVRAAGGLDALKDALSSYTDNFFSDSEKSAMKASVLSKEFTKLGLAMPTSKDSFRSLVESLNSSGAMGQELAMKVLLLADSFAELNDTTENLVASARDDLSSAYERESNALTDTRDKFLDFAKSLAEFKQSLLTGDLSTLNVADKYAVEKAKFEETLAKAKAGDADAIGSFQNVATSFLQASREMNASGSLYTADFERVLAETDAIQGLATQKASVAEQQLSALEKQVSSLITINESVLTVAQAIQNLSAVMAGVPITSTSPGVGPTMGIPQVPPMAQAASVQSDMATQNAALVASVTALSMEVASLRADQNAQTAALISANYEANMANATAVVDGTRDAMSVGNYQERAGTQLA
jgi:tape measure domain-containing protein